MPWLWSDGAEVVSPDGSRASGFFDGPKSVETVQYLADLVNEGIISHPRNKAALGVDFFLNEQAAMDLRGHWWLIDLRSRGIDVGVTTIPTNTGKPATVIYFTGLSIMKQCRQPYLAWKYIKYATSEPVQTKRVKSGLAISGNRLTADHYAGNPVEGAFLHAMEFARPPPGVKVESYAVCEDIGKEAMDNILFNGMPVQKALTEAARLMDAALYTGSDTHKADKN
jgi:multiple sugar transport system substrate-binding protein